MTDYTPRRSVLYMPGSNTRALEKAKTLNVDCLILDLEDAVAPTEKVAARQQVQAVLAAGGYDGKQVAVRINALSTEWGKEDLHAVLETDAHAVVLPKVESASEIQSVVEEMTARTPKPGVMKIWAMIETPLGVLNVESIASADPSLEVLVMGTSDLAKELRVPVRADRLGLLYSLGHCIVSARAHGLDIIDGVQLDLENEEALELSCQQGRSLGFDGKSLIHPKQIEAAHRAFSPSEAEIVLAREIIEAWEGAQAAGSGVVVVRGKLIENLHVDESRRLLALASVI